MYSLPQLFARGFSLSDMDYMMRRKLATMANRNGNTMLKVPNLDLYQNEKEDLHKTANEFFGDYDS